MAVQLIPRSREVGWTPYVFLLYLAFLFIQPALEHAGWRQWTLTLLGVAVFLPVYFAGYRVTGRRGLAVVAAITLIGAVFLPFNVGGMGFFIYAAAFLGFMFEPRNCFLLLALILAIYSAECVACGFPGVLCFSGTLIIGVIGGVNIFFGQRKRTDAKLRLAQAEVEHLAKVAERERIARDLHDVLGHTLSLIILKSELALKLIDRDAARARKEIADVEQAARAALTEVRHAIGGYRVGSLQEEFAHARATLETAGVSVDCEAAPVALTPAQETVLALVTREAITNVVRHAQASLCRLRFERAGESARLEIHDDGRGGSQLEGNGIRGMRERIEALDGRLDRDTASGTRLIVTLPLT
jgi:two-component system sensor histidine kinase DesK